MSDVLQYEAEHLLNVEISTGERGISRPEEAIIRLHQLDLTKCLNPIKVYLRLEASELQIIDQKVGCAMEKIPYSSITPNEETFVRSVSDRFPNLAILSFIDGFEMVPPEFCIFQFASTAAFANEFIQKIFEFKETSKKQQKKNKPAVASKPPKSEVSKIMEDQAQRSAFATLRYKRPANQPQSLLLIGDSNSPCSYSPNVDTQVGDKYLELLNRSLDDIEKFVARLQQGAAAYQELEKRRQNGNGVSDQGEGMLIMHARPPPSKDYYDVFQKIKFSFNLLAKLKGSIKNPTAAEMIHYVFYPLDLIVEASCAILGIDDQPLWEHVLNPLLIPESMVFMEDCLTTKEIELWRSLGSAWNISAAEREFWLNCVSEIPMYVPVFNDGWSPPPSFLTEVCPKLEPRTTPQQQQTYGQLQQPQPRLQRLSHYGADPILQRLETSPFRPIENQHSGLGGRRSNSPQLLRSSAGSSPVCSPITNNNNLHVQQQKQTEDLQKEFISKLLAKGAKVCVATWDRYAENYKELTVSKGQALEVLESNKLNSKVRNHESITGYVPTSYLAILPLSSDPTNFYGVDSGENKQRSAIDDLNEEFQLKIKTEPDPTRKKNSSRTNHASSGVITEKSTPDEVTLWLAQKGFSEIVQSRLSSFGGKQLFVMDRTVLEKIFGSDVGSRLFSQILVQRNLCGYKTMRAKELQAILEQRKKKAESAVLGDLFKTTDPFTSKEIPTTSTHFRTSIPGEVAEHF